MEIITAPYCDDESQKAGATLEQIKAGKQLVELAISDSPIVSYDTIEQTANQWVRLSAPKFSCRAIVSVSAEASTVTLHVVLPRDSNTYYKVEDLWTAVKSGKIK